MPRSRAVTRPGVRKVRGRLGSRVILPAAAEMGDAVAMRARPNVVLATITGLVIVLAVVAAVLTLGRQPPELDQATLEGTVQLFVIAVIDRDDEAAVGYLHPDLECQAPLRNSYRPSSIQMTVVSSETTGDAATVVVEVTEQQGGPFNSWSHREVFDLVRAGSGWLITGNPWPIYSCK